MIESKRNQTEYRFVVLHVLIVALLFLSACSTVSGWFSGGTDEKAEAKQKEVKASETELKLAQILTRLDDLNDKVQKQQESIRILEKSFALGLTPNSLTTGERDRFSERDAKLFSESLEKKPLPVVPTEQKKPNPNETSESLVPKGSAQFTPTDIAEFEQGFAKGHDDFRLGNYGQALAKFDELRKKFGDYIADGVHVFWIAKCWYSLKEYETAKTHLQDFVNKNPQSVHVPRAKFELAKTYAKLGQGKRATDLLRDIIKSYPYEEAAELAKMELQNLQQKL